MNNHITWISRGIHLTRIAFWASTIIALVLVPINRYALTQEMSQMFTPEFSKSDVLVSFSLAVAVGFFSYISWILLGVLGILKIAEARFGLSTSKKLALTSFIIGLVLLLSFVYLWAGQQVLNELDI